MAVPFGLIAADVENINCNKHGYILVCWTREKKTVVGNCLKFCSLGLDTWSHVFFPLLRTHVNEACNKQGKLAVRSPASQPLSWFSFPPAETNLQRN